MEDKNDYSDFIILMLMVFAILFYLVSTIWFHHLAGAWYIMKYPAMKLIDYTPKAVFDYGYIWAFWENNFSDNIKGATRIVLEQGYDNFKDENNINDILASYNLNQKSFVRFYDGLIMTFYTPIILLIIWRFYSKISTKERFIQIYTNKTLSEQESNLWLPIKPVVYEFEKMTKGSPYDQKNWWAGSETPLVYLEKRGVLKKFKEEEDDDFEIKEEFIELDVDKLYKIYVDEIGVPWTGIDNLAFEEKCVLCIILPKLYKDNKKSKAMRDVMARYYASRPYKEDLTIFFNKDGFKKLITLKWDKFKVKEKLKYKKAYKKITKDKKAAKKELNSIMDSIINKYYWSSSKSKKSLFKKSKKKEVRKEVRDIIDKHYYKNGVFVRLLEEGRATSGVLAACEMIWVKIENRPFWYILSQTGRAASFPEVSGLWSHYLAERKVNRKMAAPRVENAIFAADKYMFSTHENYRPFNEMQG